MKKTFIVIALLIGVSLSATASLYIWDAPYRRDRDAVVRFIDGELIPIHRMWWIVELPGHDALIKRIANDIGEDEAALHQALDPSNARVAYH